MFTVDLVLLVVACAAAYRLVARPASGDRPPEPIPRLITVGGDLALPGVTWDAARRHVLLSISPTCPACNDSISLYRNVSERVAYDSNVRLMVLASDPPETVQKWLDSSGVKAHRILQVANVSRLGFLLKPTILILDSNGTVTDVLIGKLPPAIEEDLLSRLDQPESTQPLDNTDYAEEIREAEFAPLTEEKHPLLLDLRDRRSFGAGHRPRAVNIPRDELTIRAKADLTPSEHVVIDCVRMPASLCRAEARFLKQALRIRVSVLFP